MHIVGRERWEACLKYAWGCFYDMLALLRNGQAGVIEHGICQERPFLITSASCSQSIVANLGRQGVT